MTATGSTISATSSNPPIPTSSSSTNYRRGVEARAALMKGVNVVNDAVAPTIGAKGHDALLGAFEWPYSIATNDGASIAERVKCSDPYEQMGVRLLQEAIGRANKESGDGSTTTCVLTAAILKEGQNYSTANRNFKEELNICLPKILESLDTQSRPVNPEEVWKVASVSAQNEEMGRMIGEIYQQIGKDGVVFWEPSPHTGMSFEIKEGIELKNVGFVHPTFINANAAGPVLDPRQGDRIIVNNPRILICAEKIHSASQINPYAASLMKEGVRELVVFCDEIEPMALAEIEATGLGINPRTGQPVPAFKIIILRAPTLWKDWIYEDFATMTGATVFGVGQAASLKGGASLSWLGTCDKLVAKRGGTDILGTKDISEHVKKLQEASYEHRDYEKRVEWLNSKSAIVRMGARSEVELTHLRLKFDDAKNAAKLALKGGIVAGAGIPLLEAAKALEDMNLPAYGAAILKEALKAPTSQIMKNAGYSDLPESAEKGINVLTGEETDMFEAGIVDPTLTLKNAISAAISVAGTILNCDTLVPYDHETKFS